MCLRPCRHWDLNSKSQGLRSLKPCALDLAATGSPKHRVYHIIQYSLIIKKGNKAYFSGKEKKILLSGSQLQQAVWFLTLYILPLVTNSSISVGV
jgi:hypothetical protein